MDRYAIFVDAGYFFSAGAHTVLGTPGSTPRKNIALKSPAATQASLCASAMAATGGLSFLRTYWYDAMPGPRLTLEQAAIAQLPGVKLRLGALNSAGEQKGVDSLIVTDIIELARNRAIADAVIVSGDEDLRIAVQLAQSFGVRVHILAAGDPSKNVSLSLQMEADSVTALDSDWFSAALTVTLPPQDPAAAERAPSEDSGAAQSDGLETAARIVVEQMLDGTSPDQLQLLVVHFAAQSSVPPDYDRPLIARVSAQLAGRKLAGTEMRRVRGFFVHAVKARGNDPDPSAGDPPTKHP